jgi:HD-GYP domain-containing protein (c-di-GMP phosphodiesterase class II)
VAVYTEEKNQNELTGNSTSSHKTLFKTVEEIFIRFSSVLKTAQIYEPNNITFIRQINPLFSLIQNIISTEGRAVFQFRENTLFFNTVRVKFDFLSYHNFKFLSDEFYKKEIGELGFEPGIDENELTQFVVLLAEGAEKESPFESFLEKTKRNGLSHIYLEKIHPFEIATTKEAQQLKKAAKKIFTKSITHLNEVFKRESQQKRLHLKTTRRLIQSIVNNVSQNEAFMIGLTNVEKHDEYTAHHSVNVAIMSIGVGRRLGLEKKELVDLGISAFFHDIGKLDVPLEILRKKDKLNKDERHIMERHTYNGAGKLACLQELSYLPVKALYVALEHHLWANLSGYPKYWKKDYINLYSKIVKIIDFFDAVTTKRPYRKHTLTRDEALSIMLEKSGTEFDPILLKVFANMIGVYPIGTLVALNSGELGIVMETNPEVAFMLRPKVKLITDKKNKKIDGEIIDLTEIDPKTKEYKKTIIKSLDPNKYNIRISDYFLAQAE